MIHSPSIRPLDEMAMSDARRRWTTRAKPPGSLGRLEPIAVQLAGIAGVTPPPVPSAPAIAVFAGDHGVVSDGASAWPSEITAAMMHAVAAGGAAINAFAAGIGATVHLVDVGVSSAVGDVPGLVDRRIRNGTASIASGSAMTESEAAEALAVGRSIAFDLIADGADCLIGGELGIGNTTASAALIAALTGADPAFVTGRGAGEPAAGLGHKRTLVAAAVERASGITDPVALLAEVGGLEIAALSGFYVGAAERRTAFVVDGVIAAAALCVAERWAPGTIQYGIAGHVSQEPASRVALEHVNLEPLLDLDLRLGEGTGAALAFPLIAAAARALADIADLPADLPVDP